MDCSLEIALQKLSGPWAITPPRTRAHLLQELRQIVHKYRRSTDPAQCLIRLLLWELDFTIGFGASSEQRIPNFQYLQSSGRLCEMKDFVKSMLQTEYAQDPRTSVSQAPEDCQFFHGAFHVLIHQTNIRRLKQIQRYLALKNLEYMPWVWQQLWGDNFDQLNKLGNRVWCPQLVRRFENPAELGKRMVEWEQRLQNNYREVFSGQGHGLQVRMVEDEDAFDILGSILYSGACDDALLKNRKQKVATLELGDIHLNLPLGLSQPPSCTPKDALQILLDATSCPFSPSGSTACGSDDDEVHPYDLSDDLIQPPSCGPGNTFQNIPTKIVLDPTACSFSPSGSTACGSDDTEITPYDLSMSKSCLDPTAYSFTPSGAPVYMDGLRQLSISSTDYDAHFPQLPSAAPAKHLHTSLPTNHSFNIISAASGTQNQRPKAGGLSRPTRRLLQRFIRSGSVHRNLGRAVRLPHAELRVLSRTSSCRGHNRRTRAIQEQRLSRLVSLRAMFARAAEDRGAIRGLRERST